MADSVHADLEHIMDDGDSQSTTTSAVDGPVSELEPRFAARVGICVLNYSEGSDVSDVYGKIVAELKEDSRIEDLQVASLGEVQFLKRQLPNSGIKGRPSGAVTLPINPDRHIHIARISPPLCLHVKVPRRVQSTRESDVPTDEYWAIWDGVVVAICWRYGDSAKPFGRAGGRIVLDIIIEAAKKAGATAVNEPCGPNCNFPFAHARLSLRSGVLESRDLSFTRSGAYDVNVYISEMNSVKQALAKLFEEVSFAGRCFATMRAESRTMQEIDQLARDDLTDLLSVYYGSVTRKFSFKRDGFKRWWRQVRWGRSANRLIARLWLAVATIEARKLDWTNFKFVYDGFAARTGIGVVFESEYAQDVNVIDHIDVSGIKSAIDHASSRLNTKSLAFATTMAAVIGALVGAVIGAVVASL